MRLRTVTAGAVLIIGGSIAIQTGNRTLMAAGGISLYLAGIVFGLAAPKEVRRLAK